MKATSITSKYESSSSSSKALGSNIIDSSLFTEFSNKHGVDEEMFCALVQDHEVIVEEARVHIAEYTAMRELADNSSTVQRKTWKMMFPSNIVS